MNHPYVYALAEGKGPSQGSLYKEVALASVGLLEPRTGIEPEIEEFVFPYVVLMSQECDLQQDRAARAGGVDDQDKWLINYLVCPAYPAEMLREGTHLEQLGRKAMRITSTPWRNIKQNQNQRYHFLAPCTDLQVPELAIDFKHFASISRDLFCRQYHTRHHYLASLREVYREQLSQRFAAFLSRIGLPVDHHRFAGELSHAAEM